ncbi:hypothetical protein ACFX11_014540 [Malus domestica]
MRVSTLYKDEQELETYIRSDLYGTCNQITNCSNPKIKGAVVFHDQGPQSFDYSSLSINGGKASRHSPLPDPA